MPSFSLFRISEDISLPLILSTIREREIKIQYGEKYKSAGFAQLQESREGNLHGFIVSAIPAIYRELISSQEGPIAQTKKSAILAVAEFGLYHNIFYVGNPRERAFRDFLLGTLGKDVKLERIVFSPETFSHLEQTYSSKTHSLRRIRNAGDSTRKLRYEIDPAEERGTSHVKELYWDPQLVDSIEVLLEYQNDFFPVSFYAGGVVRLDGRKLPVSSDRLQFLWQIIDMSQMLYEEFPPDRKRVTRVPQKEGGDDANPIDRDQEG